MRGSVEIPLPAYSAYEAAEDAKLKAGLDAMVDVTAKAANWRRRKKTLLDLIAVLEFALVGRSALESEFPGDETASMDAEAIQEKSDAAGELNAADDFIIPKSDPEDLFIAVVPMYLAAILERLAEPSITCVEQAAFYLLSAHPGHRHAAEQWLDAEHRRNRDFKKFINANRYYRTIIDRSLERAPALEF